MIEAMNTQLQTIRNTTRTFTKDIARTVVSCVSKLFHISGHGQPVADSETPKRILVLNCAHLGDLVISTSIIPILRSAYPTAEIGFAVGSWAAMVIANHPEVAFVHRVDHWCSNRSKASLFHKFIAYAKSYRRALSEIRETKYDLALCIFPYFYPDLMDLAWRASIPVRLGFRNSVFASLATETVEASKNPFFHQSAIQAEVLGPLSIDPKHLAQRKTLLPLSTEEALAEYPSLLGPNFDPKSKYCVIHMGAGALNREMSTGFWRETAALLLETHILLFTGKGKRESENIARVIDGLENCINACDRLSWDGFIAAIRNADAVYGVESMAGHVAAAVETPSFVVYSGVAGVARWRPEGNYSIVYTNHVACAPCGNLRGCEAMTCLTNISPAEIVALHPQGRRLKESTVRTVSDFDNRSLQQTLGPPASTK